MIIEYLLCEVGTTIGGMCGLKLLRLSNLNARMDSISQAKKLPLINRLLKRRVGVLSRKEEWFSKKAVKIIRSTSKYQEFRLILVLLSRRFNAARVKTIAVRRNSKHRICRASSTLSLNR